MTGFTPNRNYPYAQPTDPTDVGFYLQSLAEAVDLDVQAMDEAVVSRLFCKVSGTVQQSFIPDSPTEITFDTIQMDNAGISDLGSLPTRLTPKDPGFWFAWVEIDIPFGVMRSREVILQSNGTDISRYTQHSADGTGANSPTKMILGGMSFMNGTTDYFTATFTPDQPAPSVPQKTTRRSMGCMRMTIV